MSGYDAIPAELRALEQWVIYRLEVRPGDPKPTKVPYQAARPDRRASSTNPSTWASFETAISSAWLEGVAGIGFVFSADDPYCGIDFDDCYLPGGDIHPAAGELVDLLDSYGELSRSGGGLHVLVRARMPAGKGRNTSSTSWAGRFEAYSEGRYFTMTGHHDPDLPTTIGDRQPELEQVLTRVLPASALPAIPRTPAPLGIDDEELLERARSAKNGARFERLYAGELAEYGGDHSVADLALAGELAFWSGGDPETVDRLFRGSGLMREKWDERRRDTTYGALTIAKALEGRSQFYSPSSRRLQ